VDIGGTLQYLGLLPRNVTDHRGNVYGTACLGRAKVRLTMHAVPRHAGASGPTVFRVRAALLFPEWARI
jgi:hypothetical protein